MVAESHSTVGDLTRLSRIQTGAYLRVFLKQIPLVSAIEGSKCCKIEIMGLVVGFDEKSKFKSFTIDDGTGSIEFRSWTFKEGGRNVVSRVVKLGDMALLRGTLPNNQCAILDTICSLRFDG